MFFSTRERGLSFTLGSPSQMSCAWKTYSQNFWLSKAFLREIQSVTRSCNAGPSVASSVCCSKTELRKLQTPLTKGFWEIKTPHLKQCTEIFHTETQGKRSNLKGTWVRPTWWFGESHRESEGNWGSHWDTDTSSSHLGELILPRGHWYWQAPFWNPPSSLLSSGPSPTLIHQPVGTSTGKPHAQWLSKWGTAPPTTKQAAL